MPKNEKEKPVRPAREMTDDELNAVIDSVTPKTKVRVWYRHLSKFEIDEGMFIDGSYQLEGVEVDAVCRDVPIEVEAEEDANGDSFTVDHRGHTLEYNTSCRGGVYALEVLEPGIDCVVRTEVAGMSIVADKRANTMSLGDTELNEYSATRLKSVLSGWLKGMS